MRNLISELNKKFRNTLKNEPENLLNLQIKVLLGNVVFSLYQDNRISSDEWTEAMDIINNLN